MSSLYLRGKKVWVSFMQNGVHRSVGTGHTLDNIVKRKGVVRFSKAVLEWQSHFDQRQTLGTPMVASSRNYTFRELYGRYLEAFGSERAESTKTLYQLALDKLEEYLGGDVKVSKVNEDTIMGWRNWMIEGFGRANASVRLRSLSAILSWAEDKLLITRNPIRRDARIKVEPLEILVYSDAQLPVLLASLEAPLSDQFRCSLLTGMRSGEVCNFKWDDINYEQGSIRIGNDKEHRTDTFPIDEQLEDFFRSLPVCYAPYVFKYRSIWTVNKILKKALKALKDKDVKNELSWDLRCNVHTLRKTFISHIIRNGASETDTLYLARHKSMATTLTYYAVFDLSSARRTLALSRIKALSVPKKKGKTLPFSSNKSQSK